MRPSSVQLFPFEKDTKEWSCYGTQVIAHALSENEDLLCWSGNLIHCPSLPRMYGLKCLDIFMKLVNRIRVK